MAVKRKDILPPPIWRTGGKDEHYAIEVLSAERELILERIKSVRAEKSFTLVQRQKNIKAWSNLAAQLQIGIFILRANKSAKTRARIDGILKDKSIMNAAASCFLTQAYKQNTPPSGPPPDMPKPAPPLTGRPAIASCKNFAKCGEYSYWFCFAKCEKRKNKTCNLVRKYTRRKK